MTLRPLTGRGPDIFVPFAVRTRADGRFVLAAVDEGTWRLTAEAGERGTLATEVAVSGTETDLGRLELDSGAGLWLAPRLASGSTPVAIHVLLATSEEGQPVLQRFLPVGSDGRARLEGIPPGSWRLLVFVEGTVPEMLSIEGSSSAGETIPVLLQPATE